MRSHPQARRLGGPGSSEFNTTFILFIVLLALLMLVPLLQPGNLLLVLLLNALQLMWDNHIDTPHIIIILPTSSTNNPSFMAADFSTNCLNNLTSRIVTSCLAITPSREQTFSMWIAREDWVSLSRGEVVDVMLLLLMVGVRVVGVDLGFEVAIKREGGQIEMAEG